jgi:hypothetical protein
MGFHKHIFHKTRMSRNFCYKCGKEFEEGEVVYVHSAGHFGYGNQHVVGWLCEECYNAFYIDV